MTKSSSLFSKPFKVKDHISVARVWPYPCHSFARLLCRILEVHLFYMAKVPFCSHRKVSYLIFKAN